MRCPARLPDLIGEQHVRRDEIYRQARSRDQRLVRRRHGNHDIVQADALRKRNHVTTHQSVDRGAGEQHHDGAGDFRALPAAGADHGRARRTPVAHAATRGSAGLCRSYPGRHRAVCGGAVGPGDLWLRRRRLPRRSKQQRPHGGALARAHPRHRRQHRRGHDRCVAPRRRTGDRGGDALSAARSTTACAVISNRPTSRSRR
jgi:hypothetical protein